MELTDRFYKSTEVSEILGVSLRTLYRYMDSGKIQSVQLPSGRHRFTKQQLETFLYSNGSGGLGQVMPNQYSQPNADRVYVDTGYSQNQQVQQNTRQPNVVNNPYGSQQQNVYSNPPITQQNQVNPQVTNNYSPTPTSSPSSPFASPEPEKTMAVTEEVDDLDAELEQLLASLEEDTDDTTSAEVEAPKAPAINDNSMLGGLGNFDQDEPVVNEQPVSIVDENAVSFFYCPYNQLRAIARLVKTTSEDNSKKYAFTMNAGLSLYFPLDPFSVIHFYIEEGDLEFWKDSLQLKESVKSDANIGILVTKGRALEGSQEVSGLKVVSKSTMIANLKANGLDSLISQAESKL